MKKVLILMLLMSILGLCGCEDDETNNAPVSIATATNGYQTQPEYNEGTMNHNDLNRERRDHIHAPASARWYSTVTPSVGFVHSSNGTPNYTPAPKREYVPKTHYSDSQHDYQWQNTTRWLPKFNKKVIARVQGHSVLAEYVPNPNNETANCPCGIWVRYTLGNHNSLIIARVKHWMYIPACQTRKQRDFGGL